MVQNQRKIKNQSLTRRCNIPLTHCNNSLAYVEMWFALGVAFRRFEFELYQTTIRDVLPARDFFIGIAPADSKGVRMKVVRELS